MATLTTGSAEGLSGAKRTLAKPRLRPLSQLWPSLLIGLLALLLIVQLVRLMWVVLQPMTPLGNWHPRSATIVSPVERMALFAGLDPFFRANAQGAASANVTALGLKLYGVNINEATGGGSAIIAGEDGVQNSYAVGDEIVPGVKLAGVAFDHVLLDRGGAQESLFLDQSGTAPQAASAPVALPPPTPESAVTATATAPGAPAGEMSPDAIKAGVDFAPRSENGRVTGLAVQPLGDGSTLRAAGLRPGDVIRSINGRPIGSAADAGAFANQLTPGARISLEVERGASTVPIALILSKP